MTKIQDQTAAAAAASTGAGKVRQSRRAKTAAGILARDGWVQHAVVIGSAAVVALAATVALRMHAGLDVITAYAAAVSSFAGMMLAHLLLRPRPARVAPSLSLSRAAGNVTSAKETAPAHQPADMPAANLAAPVASHAGMNPTPAKAGAAAVALEGFEYLQSLVAELARMTPGPKATTPDPDATGAAVNTIRSGLMQSDGHVPAQVSAHADALALALRTMDLTGPRQSVAGRPAVPAMADQLTDALAGDRLAVYLEPIQQIDSALSRHYEVLVRFKAADGQELPHDDLLAAAREAGLLPRVDAAVLPRAARIAQYFHRRGHDTDILSRIHGESLPDQTFRSGVTAAMIAADGASMVLSFAQDDVRGFGPIHWEILSAMSDMGLRFAVESVTDLDMDFEALYRRGFNFIKLDADVLRKGLPAGGGHIASADVCRHFASTGLALIVNHIDDEAALARILGFGVLFGQGALFGAKRAVRADLLSVALAA